MKYKVGDKVKILEHGARYENSMSVMELKPEVESFLNNLPQKRVVTIKNITDLGYYQMVGGNQWTFADYQIEEAVLEEIFEPITSRFEILDL